MPPTDATPFSHRDPAQRIRRIILYAAGGLLLISLILSCITGIPLYQLLKTQRERELQVAVDTKQVAVDEFLARARNVARQITSRTRVRQELEAYNRGEIRMADLRVFSRDKLIDALDRSAEVLGILRLTTNLNTVVAVGMDPTRDSSVELPIPPPGRQELLVTPPTVLDGEHVILVGAPIIDRQGVRQGVDIVVFSVERLGAIVREIAGLGSSIQTFLGIPEPGGYQLFYFAPEDNQFIGSSISTNRPLAGAFRAARETPDGLWASPEADRDPHVYAARAIDRTSWSIVVRMHRQALYGPVIEELIWVVAALLAVILAGVAGVIRMIRPLLRDLRHQQERLEDLYENAPDMFASVDAATAAVLHCNATMCQVLGRTREEIIGMSVFDLYHPEDVERSREAFETFLQTGEVRDLELRILPAGGPPRYVLVNATAVRDPDGRILHSRSIWRDIHDRKIAELQLEQAREDLEIRIEERTAELSVSNQRLSAEITERRNAQQTLQDQLEFLEVLLETIPVPIFYKDPDGVFIGCNEAFEQFIGKERDEILGHHVREFVPADLARLYVEKDEELFARQDPQIYEAEVAHSDGSRHAVVFHKATFQKGDGSLGGLVGVIVDITDIRRVEQTLQTRMGEVEQLNRGMTNLLEDLQAANRRLKSTTRQLEEANRELESFSYSVSHDLRAPLRAIHGFAGALWDDWSRRLDPRARQDLQTIMRNAVAMGHLIDDLLAFSRLGRQAIAREEVDMNALAREVWQELRPPADERTLTCTIADLPPALGDVNMLRQVWANLIGNAVKYTQPREEARIEIGADVRDDKIHYYVRDNGVGFDIQYADSIFGIFQRLHSSADFEGTGVGLAIVQRILHRHGGEIRVEAAGEQGATFSFSLPAPGEEG